MEWCIMSWHDMMPCDDDDDMPCDEKKVRRFTFPLFFDHTHTHTLFLTVSILFISDVVFMIPHSSVSN
jgi:hypothetical protein